MTQKGHTVIFDPEGCKVVSRDGKIIVTATESSGIYQVDADVHTAYHAREESEILWHRRLGHLN